MNMDFIDIFTSPVKTVTLHAYNLNGDLVFNKTEKVSDIAANGGYMKLDIKPGIYTSAIATHHRGRNWQPQWICYTQGADRYQSVRV